MKYKKTLLRLHDESGLDYNNIKQVQRALEICESIGADYQKELESTLCYHNTILKDLYKYKVINEEEYLTFYDLPSYMVVLNDLDHLLFRIQENQKRDYDKLFVQGYRYRLEQLKILLEDDEELEKISKKNKFLKYKEMKEDIKRNNKEYKALVYQIKKLKNS